jgi:hypothetical protein
MMKRLFAVSVLTMISVLGAVAHAYSPADQITEVTLERTPCFGTCPNYKVTLRSDGTITYEGKRFVTMMGTYKGQAYGFDKLAQFILAQDYFNLNDNYRIGASDLPSAITSVVQNGKRKTIVDYGGAGPIGLWGIEMSIDGILRNAKLEQVPAAPTHPVRRRR